MNHRSVLSLLNQARRYGPLVLKADHISCSQRVPIALRKAIGARYFDAQALLTEFDGPGPAITTPVILIAEAIVREAQRQTSSITKNNHYRKKARQRPSQMPLF